MLQLICCIRSLLRTCCLKAAEEGGGDAAALRLARGETVGVVAAQRF
jgi:hypothetical protein